MIKSREYNYVERFFCTWTKYKNIRHKFTTLSLYFFFPHTFSTLYKICIYIHIYAHTILFIFIYFIYYFILFLFFIYYRNNLIKTFKVIFHVIIIFFILKLFSSQKNKNQLVGWFRHNNVETVFCVCVSTELHWTITRKLDSQYSK